ncbi:MAG: cell division protein ZapA [Oscillospiraceae bacterium]|nr:cell division protein ZapA [Oscillospiraceae bacterium]
MTKVKSRVVVTIGGQEFTLLAEKNEDYVKRVAARVDEEVMTISNSLNAPGAQVALLAAINLAEESLQAIETADSLRRQLKDFLEESSRLKQENADLKREMTRLKKQGSV